MGGRGQFRVMSDDSWASFGGYMNAKIQKLDQQFEEESSNIKQISTIFKNVAILVNGYTIPTSDQLKILMAQHGGKFHNYYLSSSTTHIIASNLAYAKTKGLKRNQIVVYPQWITDSIKEGKLLPVHSYLIAGYGMNKNQGTLEKFVKPPLEKTLEPATEKEDFKSNLEDNSSSSSHYSDKSSRQILPTTNSSFLSEFYSHSRLHFLSTWKTELVDYVRTITQSNDNLFEGKQELLRIASTNYSNIHPHSASFTYITHIDMDCFFVSVGLLSRPHLKNKPIAVTHHPADTPSVNLKRPGVDEEYERNYYKQKKSNSGSSSHTDLPGIRVNGGQSSSKYIPSYSEIASCNYKAREAGLKNGMFYGKAKELCPDLIAIPYDFDAYRHTSQTLYDVLISYTTHIEAVSCDEALLDISDLVAVTGLEPEVIVRHIRDKIKERTGCDASAGIGPNIVLAKMATRVGKPNGQHHVVSDQALNFIRDLPVKNLPGVGYATANRLRELNVSTCGELQSLSLDFLKKEFGVKTGEKLHNSSIGVDHRKVCSSKERKSVSADVNYGIRLSTEDELNIFFTSLSKEVSGRLKKAQVRGKKITLKVLVRKPDAPVETVKFGGYGVCDAISRSKAIDSYTDDCDLINTEVVRLRKLMQISVNDLRGIGIQITQLNSTTKPESNSTSKITNYVKQIQKPLLSEPAINLPENNHDKSSATSDKPCFSKLVTSTPIASKKPESPQCEISSSFLAALPQDLQDEVKKDWKAHQNILQRSKNTHSSTTTRSNKNSPSKPAVRLKKSPVKKKRGPVKPVSAGGSPNKLITDLFPVVTKPVKPVRRKIIENPLPDIFEVKEKNLSEPSFSVPSPPSLGGAVTIEESRDAVRNWTKSFLTSQPDDDDVNEVVRYLSRLVSESHDMEGACLVLHTLRRSILNLIDNLYAVDTQINIDFKVKSWTTLYNKIASNVSELVKHLYDGASINIKFIE